MIMPDRPIHRGSLRTRKEIWGKSMEHFATEKWIDFVNQAVDTNEKQLMERHLQQGCKRCRKTVSPWQKVRQSAASEANYQPTEHAVRLDSAALAEAGLASQRKAGRRRLNLLFH